MNSTKLFSFRAFAALAMGLVAMIFAMTSDAKAQEAQFVQTSLIGGEASDFPTAVEHNYEATSVSFNYTENGDSEVPALQGAGRFQGVTVDGVFCPLGGTVHIPYTTPEGRLKVKEVTLEINLGIIKLTIKWG